MPGRTPRRAAAVTALCGFAHVTLSVAVGLAGILTGRELLQAFGRRLEGVAGLLLIGFGVAYGVWGLQRTLRHRAHAHAHAHGFPHAHRHVHAHSGGSDGEIHRSMTAWTLFVVFAADPCVAIIPLMFAAAPLGWTSTAAVVGAYELATIGTMVALVLPMRAAIGRVRGAWADQWGDAVAGGVVAFVGVVVMSLGI